MPSKTWHAVNGVKRCRACGLDKPVTDFAVNRGSKDGFSRDCRLCGGHGPSDWRSGQRRMYCKRGHLLSEDNVIERKNGARRCRQCERDHYSPEKRKALHEKNRERENAQSRRWYSENREYHRELRETWKAENPTYHSEHNKKWHREHPEEARARSRRTYEANKARVHVRTKARRLRLRGVSGVAPYEAIEARMAYYGWRCVYCGGPFEEVDHAFPVSRGGSNWPANLVPSCRSCNRRKHQKNIWEFLNEHCSLVGPGPLQGKHKKLGRTIAVYMAPANRGGTKGPNARFVAEQIIEMRRLYSTGTVSTRSLAEKYGVSSAIVGKIVSYRSYLDVKDDHREACMAVLQAKSPQRKRVTYT